jgi:hypothetical protein
MNKFRTILVRSKDKGRTWFYVSTIAAGNIGTEGFNEPVLLHLTKGKNKGRLICAIRTGRDLYSTYSDDQGSTWSKAGPMEFQGIDIYNIKDWMGLFEEPDAVELRGAFVDPDLIEMDNGVLACAFGVRIPEKAIGIVPGYVRTGNYISFSLDQGTTWSHTLQLTSGILSTDYMTIRELEPGEIYAVYDLGLWIFVKADSERSIMGRKIKVELKQDLLK